MSKLGLQPAPTTFLARLGRALGRDARRHDRLGLYRACTPPPADFDPHTAPNAVLFRHGLPRRPDAEREPELARIWKRVFERPLRYVKAELKSNTVMSDRTPAKFPDDPVTEDPGVIWVGAVAQTVVQADSSFAPFTWAFAEWEIPGVSTKRSVGEGDFYLGCWVGLGGYYSDELVQAGVAVSVTRKWWTWFFGSKVKWFVWTEWWTAEKHEPAVEIANFPVKPGDTVSVIVCVPQPDSAFIFIRNVTTGRATSLALSAPEGYPSKGHSVEWIVEPGGSKFARFTTVTFNDCLAGKATGLAHPSFTLDYRPQVDAQIVNPNSVTVQWIDI